MESETSGRVPKIHARQEDFGGDDANRDRSSMPSNPLSLGSASHMERVSISSTNSSPVYGSLSRSASGMGSLGGIGRTGFNASRSASNSPFANESGNMNRVNEHTYGESSSYGYQVGESPQESGDAPPNFGFSMIESGSSNAIYGGYSNSLVHYPAMTWWQRLRHYFFPQWTPTMMEDSAYHYAGSNQSDRTSEPHSDRASKNSKASLRSRVLDAIESHIPQFLTKDTKVTQWLGSLLFSFLYLIKSIRSSLRIYLTSLFSLIFSVIIIGVMYQTIQKSNLIFMYIAEGNAGEMDFVWQKQLSNTTTDVFLNLTQIELDLFPELHAFPRSNNDPWNEHGRISNILHHTSHSDTFELQRDVSLERREDFQREASSLAWMLLSNDSRDEKASFDSFHLPRGSLSPDRKFIDGENASPESYEGPYRASVIEDRSNRDHVHSLMEASSESKESTDDRRAFSNGFNGLEGQPPMSNENDDSIANYITGVSARWLIPGTISNPSNMSRNSSAIFLIVDTDREKEIGIGRNWKHRPLGVEEIHVRDVLLKAIDVPANRGREARLSLSLQGLISILDGESIDGVSNPTSDGGGYAPQDPLSDKDALRLLLTRAGFPFEQMFTINVTRIAEDRGIEIPPPLKPIVDEFGIINATGEEIFQFLTNGSDLSSLGHDFRVVDSVEASDGYYASALGNVIVMDSKFMKDMAQRIIRSSTTIQFLLIAANIEEDVNQFLETFRFSDFSLMTIGMLKDRYRIYSLASDPRSHHMIRITNQIQSLLGIRYPITATYPLLKVMELSNFLSLFLDQIFNSVLVILGILACILLNMLLMSNIDDHVYEYGMLRALGINKWSLGGIIISYALFFAIPGVAIGLLCAFLIHVGIEGILSWAINAPTMNVTMKPLAIIIPTLVGLGVPLIANVVPARRALSRSLRDALDLTFQTFNQTTVTMIRLEKLGLEPWQTVLALLLIIAGFIVYYMIPYGFIFKDFSLFFFILNSILLAMKLGLCLVAVVLQPVLERIILFVILWGPDRRMKNLIRKNMAGHRNRSRQTYIMFTIATAFVIFAGVSFSLQTSAIVQNAENLLGAHVVAFGTSRKFPMNEERILPFLQTMKDENVVEDFAFASIPLNQMPLVARTQLSSLADWPRISTRVFAVPENFLRVSMSNYFLYTDVDPSFNYERVGGKPDIIHSLYADEGQAHIDGEIEGFAPEVISTGVRYEYLDSDISHDSTRAYHDYIDFVASSATREALSLAIKSPALMTLQINYKGRGFVFPWLLKPKAFVYKFPGFTYSSYSITAPSSPMLISERHFKRCLSVGAETMGMNETETRHFTTILKNRLHIRLVHPDRSTDRDRVINGLRSMVNGETIMVQSVDDVVASTATAKTILNWAFNILAFLACVLCFLNLFTAFTANVRDNQWIYGVLRSLGMTGAQLTRAYVYEALCLIMAAFFSGTIIGTAIALTLVLQQNIFLENPLIFDFPWILFIFLFVMAFCLAVLGSLIPSRLLQRKDIAFILKGL